MKKLLAVVCLCYAQSSFGETRVYLQDISIGHRTPVTPGVTIENTQGNDEAQLAVYSADGSFLRAGKLYSNTDAHIGTAGKLEYQSPSNDPYQNAAFVVISQARNTGAGKSLIVPIRDGITVRLPWQGTGADFIVDGARIYSPFAAKTPASLCLALSDTNDVSASIRRDFPRKHS